MSLHDDLFAAAAVPLLMEVHGDANRVVYAPYRGVAVDLTAVVGHETAEEQTTSTGRRRIVRRQILITKDPDGTYGGVAQPEITATVTIDGVRYAVESLRAHGPNVCLLVILRNEAMEVSREDYRHR